MPFVLSNGEVSALGVELVRTPLRDTTSEAWARAQSVKLNVPSMRERIAAVLDAAAYVARHHGKAEIAQWCASWSREAERSLTGHPVALVLLEQTAELAHV